MNLRWLVMVVLVGTGGMGWCGTNEDNRPVGAVAVRMYDVPVDDSQVIRFSTTIPANTAVQIVPDHYVFYGASMVWPSGITFSTQPATSNGGRSFLFFQFIESAGGINAASGGAVLPQNEVQRLYYDFNTTVSTQTSPYLNLGQTFPPQDWTYVYQGTVTVLSTATARLGGYIITEKRRQ